MNSQRTNKLIGNLLAAGFAVWQCVEARKHLARCPALRQARIARNMYGKAAGSF